MGLKIKKSTSGKLAIRARRKKRIRAKVEGSPARPRLCVTKTNRLMVVQIIDDTSGNTLLRAQTPKGKTANIKLATELGKDLAAQAKAKGINAVVFDRSGQLYHGRVAAVAAGARDGGLSF